MEHWLQTREMAEAGPHTLCITDLGKVLSVSLPRPSWLSKCTRTANVASPNLNRNKQPSPTFPNALWNNSLEKY